MVGLSSTQTVSAQYCQPTTGGAQFWGDFGITRFVFGNVTYNYPNNDYAGTGYFYDQTTDLEVLRLTNYAVGAVYDQNQGNSAFSVWVDLDKDGIFAASERIGGRTQNTGAPGNFFGWPQGPFTINMRLPCDAKSGITRMRVLWQAVGLIPTDPCTFRNTTRVSCRDFDLNILGDFTASFPDNAPESANILDVNEIYDGRDTDHPHPSITLRGNVGSTFDLTYSLIGPAPSTDTNYQAKWTARMSVNGTELHETENATGSMAGVASALNTNGAGTGEYKVYVTAKGTGGCADSEWDAQFTIAADKDMSTRLIRSPRTNEAPRRFKYPSAAPIPIEGIFQNVGKDDAYTYDAIATLWGPNGTEVYTDTVSIVDDTLASSERRTITFKNFNPVGGGHPVGLYTAKLCVDLVDPFPDESVFNDCLPRPTTPDHVFEIAYNEEAGVFDVTVPNEDAELFALRPFRPEAIFDNGGIQDLSDVPVRVIITKMATNIVVADLRGVVPDIGAGQFNKAIFTFPTFTPDEAGDYQFCFRVEYPGDPVADNNEICVIRNVQDNLNGTYTIGMLKDGQPRNFRTIDAAMDELYRKGVRTAVTFEFTDANYTVEGQTTNAAWDMSSRIVGVSESNHITFKPSLDRSLSKGSVTIRLKTESGIGILFGQNAAPSNGNAIQNQLYYGDNVNANSAGYITIDGGRQKSIRLTIEKVIPPNQNVSQFEAVVYLDKGSSNITIQNTVIAHASGVTPIYQTRIPEVLFNSGSNLYQFEENTRFGATYSAGIIQRDTINPDNRGNLDTLINMNNTFHGNDISGFGFGIMSIGIGQLIKGGVNEFTGYYNQGTRITDNKIYNVRRTAIFLGFEDGAVVTGNRIYNVGAATGGTEANVAGILAGATGRYNNMGLRLERNEISGVKGTTWSRGIVVDNVQNRYANLSSIGKGFVPRSQSSVLAFPNKPENTMVGGNIVWGLARGSSAGNMAGVHVTTRREMNVDPVTMLLTPAEGEYFSVGDTVANNTILMQNDNATGTGAIVGVGVQNANGPVVINNAIAMLGAQGAADLTHSAIFYQGTLFRNGRANDWYLPNGSPASLVSNKNAFFTPNAGLARFVEISHSSELVSAGSQDEFLTIAQWRAWTEQDINSVVGDFVDEHEFRGIAPNQQLRVRVTPQPPLGSILNDRGDRINSLPTDIDGSERGETGLGFDIGADEFEGRLYVSDLESVDILSPSAYKSTSGTTSEAEYIMTEAPVDVEARVRNSGALPRTNASVRVLVYIETEASNDAEFANPVWETIPAVDKTIQIDLTSGEVKDIAFGIDDFTPMTYDMLPVYDVPARFASMTLNTTPRYRIEVSLNNDENNSNNTTSKTVRFYIKRSQMSIMLSTRSSSTALDNNSTVNEIAGRLNADSLVASLTSINFVNDPGNDLYAWDMLDRNSWEPRAIDYTIYRTMFWSHDQNAFTRTERDDIRNFVDAGMPDSKKNLSINSQEPVRQHVGLDVVSDENFVRYVLRATNAEIGTPALPDYEDGRIIGSGIARNTEETIISTTNVNDVAPMPALMNLYSDNLTSGIALTAYNYHPDDRTTNASIAGTATASLNTNVVYVGIDWRHFANAGAFTGNERVLRGTIDFFEDNGGDVVPVELVSFDAASRNNDVDVFWATASEQNSDHFVVERATKVDGKAGDIASATTFDNIGVVSAAGNSTERRDYSIVDNNLAAGTYIYRLVMVDKDGATATSNEVEVLIGANAPFSIASVTPNPVRSAAVLTVNSENAGIASISLVDISGRTVATVYQGAIESGTSEFNVDASKTASGTYVMVVTIDGNTVTTPVTVAK